MRLVVSRRCFAAKDKPERDLVSVTEVVCFCGREGGGAREDIGNLCSSGDSMYLRRDYLAFNRSQLLLYVHIDR